MQNSELIKKISNIKLVIFDVDGVLTDGRLYFGANGEELKVFYVHDGLGIKLLQKNSITAAIISSRQSEIVTKRLQDLGIKYIYQGEENKQKPFQELLDQLNLQREQVAYVGDDLPDLALIQQVGFGICVANAHPLLKKYALWQTEAKGGEGAVREVCELILQAQGKLVATHRDFLIA